MISNIKFDISHTAPLQNKKPCHSMSNRAFKLAERTGLEPATPGVTGRYSNQLNYHSW